MRHKTRLLPFMIGISLVLHGGIFLLFAVHPAINEKIEPITEDKPFALINIAILEPEKPPLVNLPAVIQVPLPLFSDLQTEEYIPLEETPEELQQTTLIKNDTAESIISLENTTASTGTVRNAPAQNAARKAYLDRNLGDIQRRIKNKLVYPGSAIKAGTKGTVELGFTILINGSVQDVQVTLSSGHEILDNAAIETIYAAAPFRPPPVEIKIIIPVVYSFK